MALAIVSVAGLALAAARPDPKSIAPDLKRYDSPAYAVYTDVPADEAREAVIRMTQMALEYHERTKNLFAGQINQQLPFYLFAKPADYAKASQMPGSAGIFTGDALMASADLDAEGHVGPGTWHTVQHEGFHQFVFAVIRGEIPTWANEGLAEYFGEGIFTGDGMITGVVSSGRMHRVQREIREHAFKSTNAMMQMSASEWSNRLEVKNYDQAWSMVHFLAQGEGGKYQNAFAQFLQLVGKGNGWERAWNTAFGSVEGFEQKWKDYWLKMPENPTLDLYAKATVATFTSYVGRSFSQQVPIESFGQFIARDAKHLRAAPADWLPPALYTDMQELAGQLQAKGAKYSLLKYKGPLPQILCLMPDGTRIVGTFTLNGNRIGKVTTELLKSTTEKKADKK